MDTAIKHSVPDRVKTSRSALGVRVPGCQKFRTTA